ARPSCSRSRCRPSACPSRASGCCSRSTRSSTWAARRSTSRARRSSPRSSPSARASSTKTSTTRPARASRSRRTRTRKRKRRTRQRPRPHAPEPLPHEGRAAAGSLPPQRALRVEGELLCVDRVEEVAQHLLAEVPHARLLDRDAAADRDPPLRERRELGLRHGHAPRRGVIGHAVDLALAAIRALLEPQQAAREPVERLEALVAVLLDPLLLLLA